MGRTDRSGDSSAVSASVPLSDHPALIEIERVVGKRFLLTERDVVAGYETDWTRRFSGTALAVVRAGSVEEVSKIVRICASHDLAIVPQGGNTGLVGGGVPRGAREQIVLSTTRFRDIGEVDGAAREVTAGAGVTLARLQMHVESAGFTLGVDLASRDSATLGGLVATNAGGALAFKFGTVRDQLTGVEAVLGTGAIVSRLTSARKDNTGYHFPSLFAGSEGTLGIVTSARLRLAATPKHKVAVLMGLKTVQDAVGVIDALSQTTDDVRAAELLSGEGIELVASIHGLTLPFASSYPAYLLVELAGPTDPTDVLAEVLEESPVRETAIGSDPATRQGLWRFRELHTESIGTRASDSGGVVHKLDIAVPPRKVPEFVEMAKNEIALLAPQAECYIFGHVGDGNLHINLLTDLDARDVIDERILGLAVACGGSISAEHGIGTAKARWLRLSRSDAEIDAMRDIKRALDPQGILNPGVLLPIET